MHQITHGLTLYPKQKKLMFSYEKQKLPYPQEIFIIIISDKKRVLVPCQPPILFLFWEVYNLNKTEMRQTIVTVYEPLDLTSNKTHHGVLILGKGSCLTVQ